MVGFGPVVQLRTGTDDAVSTGKWAAGPGVVVVAMLGHWVTGGVASNVWSFAGDEDRSDVNSLTLQYFINYNIHAGWYLVSSPLLTANWEAASGDQWTVPFGGGVGKIFAIGKQKNNVYLQAFWNAVKPDSLDGPDWQLRFQWTFLFPK